MKSTLAILAALFAMSQASASPSFPTGRFGDMPNPRYSSDDTNSLEISALGDDRYYVEFHSVGSGGHSCGFRDEMKLENGGLRSQKSECVVLITFHKQRRMIELESKGPQDKCNELCGTRAVLGGSFRLSDRISGTDQITDASIRMRIKKGNLSSLYASLSTKQAALLPTFGELKKLLLEAAHLSSTKLHRMNKDKKAWEALYPAANLYSKYWRDWPSSDNLSILVDLAEYGIGAKDYYEASSILTSVLKLKPDMTTAFLLLGKSEWNGAEEDRYSSQSKQLAQWAWQQYALKVPIDQRPPAALKFCELCSLLSPSVSLPESPVKGDLKKHQWKLKNIECVGEHSTPSVKEARDTFTFFQLGQMAELIQTASDGELLLQTKAWLKGHEAETQPNKFALRILRSGELEILEIIDKNGSQKLPLQLVTIEFPRSGQLRLKFSEPSSTQFCGRGHWQKTYEEM